MLSVGWKNRPIDWSTVVGNEEVRKTFTKSPVQACMLSNNSVATIESLRGRQLRASETPSKPTSLRTNLLNKTILSP